MEERRGGDVGREIEKRGRWGTRDREKGEMEDERTK
jgi:hypothetical protein